MSNALIQSQANDKVYKQQTSLSLPFFLASLAPSLPPITSMMPRHALLIAKRPSSRSVALGQEARRFHYASFDLVELLDHLRA